MIDIIMKIEWFLNWFPPTLTSAVMVVFGSSSWNEDYTEKWENLKLWIFIQEVFGFCQLDDLLEPRS